MDGVRSLVGQIGSGLNSLMGLKDSSSTQDRIEEVAGNVISSSNSSAESQVKPIEKKDEASSAGSGITILNSNNSLLSSVGRGINSLSSKWNSAGDSPSSEEVEASQRSRASSVTKENIVDPNQQKIDQLEDVVADLQQVSQSQGEDLKELNKTVEKIGDQFKKGFDVIERSIEALSTRVDGLEQQVKVFASQAQTIHSGVRGEIQLNNSSFKISSTVEEIEIDTSSQTTRSNVANSEVLSEEKLVQPKLDVQSQSNDDSSLNNGNDL
jgi:hypothetical protein